MQSKLFIVVSSTHEGARNYRQHHGSALMLNNAQKSGRHRKLALRKGGDALGLNRKAVEFQHQSPKTLHHVVSGTEQCVSMSRVEM